MNYYTIKCSGAEVALGQLSMNIGCQSKQIFVVSWVLFFSFLFFFLLLSFKVCSLDIEFSLYYKYQNN